MIYKFSINQDSIVVVFTSYELRESQESLTGKSEFAKLFFSRSLNEI